ncbi:MAG TPA: hypothetical protein VH592_16130 [Gemmataceae bacterium]|jgi:hypothetical protein
MSYDPYAYSSEPPDEYGGPRMPPPGDRERIKGRVQAPAICLIVVGILNLFWALYMLVNGIAWTVAPDWIIESEKKLSPAFQNPNATREEQQMQGIIISYPTAVLAFVASVLPIVGGARMLSLKSYTLSVSGAISAMIPCLSCMACCGVGEGIGIWALIVLMNPDIKSAFQ